MKRIRSAACVLPFFLYQAMPPRHALPDHASCQCLPSKKESTLVPLSPCPPVLSPPHYLCSIALGRVTGPFLPL